LNFTRTRHLAEKPYFSTNNSSRNPIKKSLTTTLYKEKNDEMNTPGKRMQNFD